MIHPEIPKSKKKGSYIVGGIFALLVGLVSFLLFLPDFLDKYFQIKPWDWATLIPDINAQFFAAVAGYLGIAVPVIIFLCAVSSLFLGLSKSGGLFKGSIMASALTLIIKYALGPANLTQSMKDTLGYVAYGFLGIALVLAVLGTVFRFIGEEPYVPFRANSFHFYASYALIIISAFGVLDNVIGGSFASNPHYYVGTAFGLFLIVAAIWMFCTSTRDPSEFGLGYEREAKIKAEEKKQAAAQANAAQGAQGAQMMPPKLGPDGKPIPQQMPPRIGPDGKPLPPMPAQPGVQQQAQANVQAQQMQPGAQPQQAQTGVQPPRPQTMQTPNGNVPPRPVPQNGTPIPPRPMPPRIGPDGKPLPPMPPRMGPDGKPLPPMPPRPVNPNGAPQQPPQNPQQPTKAPAQTTQENKDGDN